MIAMSVEVNAVHPMFEGDVEFGMRDNFLAAILVAAAILGLT